MKKQTILIIALFLFLTASITASAAAPTAVRIQAVIQNSQPPDPAIGGIPSSIYYILVDENGRPLTEVSIEESSVNVTLDGVPQGAVTSTVPNTPLFVAMTLDVSTSMQTYQQEMVTAVTQATNSSPDTARFGLLTFDHKIYLPERFLADRHLLQDALRGITIPEDRYTCLYDAANEAVKSLEPIIEESPAIRRAVILFTDGANKPAPNAPCLYNTQADVNNIIEFAQDQQVAIYTISFGNEADISLLETLAQETGGLAFTGEGSMEQKFSEVMRSLNSQRVAHTTLFPETSGEHTLTLNLRVTGEAQETKAIEAGSLVINTEMSFPPPASLAIVEHSYEAARQQIIVTIDANKAAAIDCVTLKLRDMETIEAIGSRQICKPEEGRSTHILDGLPPLIDGRDYRLEIDAESPLCPQEEQDGERNACFLPFKVDTTEPFTFDVSAQPNDQQITVSLRNLDTEIFPWVEYTAIFEQDGTTLETVTGFVQDPSMPFVIAYYPAQTGGNDSNQTSYKIQLDLSGPNGQAGASKDVTLLPPDKISIFKKAGTWLNQRPFLATFLLLLLIALPLLYFGRSWLEQQLPGTRFLFSKGVNGRSQSPIKSITQLPEVSWTPPAPQPKPVPAAVPAVAATAVAPPTLRILQAPGETAVNSVDVAPLPFRMGREGCHLTIGDDRTSRTHATIQRIGHQYFITDMGSRNGTYLNDEAEPLSPNMRWPLAHGDRIRLGTTVELAFNLPDPAEGK